MSNEIINTIIKEKNKCYFISPHLDDAVLSAGDLMHFLSNKTEVTVVNVFTKAGNKPHSLSAKAFLKQSRAADSKKLFTERIKEDKAVLDRMGVKVMNLNMVDALWRNKVKTSIFLKPFSKLLPELNLIYPTYRFHINKGRVAKHDSVTAQTLKTKLSFIRHDDYVFCPAGIGNHVDHIIVRDICKEEFKNVIYWSDFPYNQSHHLNEFLKKRKMGRFEYKNDIEKKHEFIKGYKTQWNALFPNGRIPKKAEKFYLHP